MKRRVLSVLLALVVVSSVVPTGAAASTATTSGDLDDCDWTDMLTYVYSGCTDTEDYNESAHDLETHVDLYTHLSTQDAATENYLTVVHNYREDLDSRAWMIAETTMAQEYENGSSQAEAEAAVRQEVGEYYSIRQENQIDRWNTSVEAYRYSIERADQQGLDRVNVTSHNINPTAATEAHTADDFTVYDERYEGVETATVELANGSTQPVRALNISYRLTRDGGWDEEFNNSVLVHPGNVNTSTPVPADNTATVYMDAIQTNVKGPTSDYDTFAYFWFEDWTRPMSGVTSQENETQNEVKTFIEASYADFETGELNSSEILSTVTIMEEYGLEGAGENATFSDVTAALAATGVATPNLAETGYMNVTYTTDNGTTVYKNRAGMLAVRDMPNGSWDTNGTTYHTDDIDGPVMFARQDGALYDLNGTFTIHGATDKDGNEVGTVTTEDVNYQVSNTSELQEVITKSIDLQENITVHTAGDGGGGGSTTVESGFSWPWEGSGLGGSGGIVLIVAVGGGMFLLGKLS